jgi:tRNA (mo5U34)-methyltransferase
MAERQSTSRNQKTVAELGPWFHNVHLPDGTQTAPQHPLGDFPRFKWETIAPHIPEDLTGWRALDIGCNAGFYTVELARRGAQVVGIDVDPHFLTQAQWVAKRCGVADRVEFRRMQVYDLAAEEGKYDLVLFLGVMYHLRYPMLGLDIVAQKVGRMMVCQCLGTPGPSDEFDLGYDIPIQDRSALQDERWPKLAFVEHRLFHDPTNWWVPNEACLKGMLRSAGMRILTRIDAEAFVVEPDPNNPSPMATWNEPELLSALQRPWQTSWEAHRGTQEVSNL